MLYLVRSEIRSEDWLGTKHGHTVSAIQDGDGLTELQGVIDWVRRLQPMELMPIKRGRAKNAAAIAQRARRRLQPVASGCREPLDDGYLLLGPLD
jgi:hypothetical protein